MTGREIRIHISFTRRSLIVLGVVLALLAGGVVFAVVGTRSASAAGTGRTLCVNTSGTVVLRTRCLTGERTLAAGRYRTRSLTPHALQMGLNTMPKPRAGEMGAKEGEPPPAVLTATEMFQSSLYAFTVRYDVPASWTGRILGACPDYAPMYVSAAMYSPEWQPVIDAMTSPLIYGAPLGSSTYQVDYRRNEADLETFLGWAAEQAWPISPAAPFTLYVTQVCGSIVALNPTG